MNCEQSTKWGLQILHNGRLDFRHCASGSKGNLRVAICVTQSKNAPKTNVFRCVFIMPPTGVEPVLCLQKGILSPSCLPISPQRHTDTRLIKSCYPALLQGAGNNRRKVQMPHLSSMMGTSLNFKSMMLMMQQSALFVKKRLCRNRQNCHQYLLLMASTMRSVCSRPFVSCIRLEIIALI